MRGNELQSPVLLVQCCHLPQFFFIARLLRQKNPDVEIHALVVDHPHVRQYLPLFEKFAKVHFSSTPNLQEYSEIIFPLLNRGYRGLKRQAARPPGRHWECDYAGELLPLSRGRLIRSYLTPPHQADSHFVEFLNDFPHRPLGEEILILNSAHKSLQEQYDQPLKELLAQAGTITRLDPSSFWKAWRSVRGKSFDGAVVFFSGERGRFHLKLLPFLKRIPRIVIFNESRGYFHADWRGLARFWFQRLRHGVVLPKRIPSILLLQSEVKEYVAGAAKNLRLGHLYPEARITVLCKEADRDYLAKIPEIDETIPYSHRNQLLKTFQVAHRLNPDIVSAVFSGRPVYRATRMLFLGLIDRARLVFNAQLDCYWLPPRTFGRLREKGTLLPGLAPTSGSKVVVVQTDTLLYLKEVVRKVQGPKFYPKSEIVVVARAPDADRVARIPGVHQVIPWSPQDRFLSLRKTVRRLHPEAIFATFTGRRGPAWQKLFFLLFRGIPQGVFNSQLDCYWLTPRTLLRLREKGILLGPGSPSILLLQSEVKEYLAGAAKTLQLKHLYPQARIVALCKEEDWNYLSKIPEINEAIPYTRQNQLRKTYRAIREVKPDMVAAVFSGRPLYRASRLIFLGMVNRPRLVFNAQLDCYRLSVRTLFRLRERGTLLHGLKMEVATKVVVVQTEGLPYLQEVVKRVRGPKFYPESEVVVLAKAQDAQRVAGISGVDQVIPWSTQDRFFSLRRKIKKLRPEAVFATFTGRPGHRRQKLFFMLFRGTPRGVFNARLDAYWLSLKTVRNLFRSEPPLFAEEERRRTVVLLQTESWRNVAAAAQRLGSKKLFPQAEVVAFCKQQDADRLEACSAISRVMVYSKSNPAGLRHDLKEIRRLQPDAITAIFSNPRSFPAAKTLFLLSRSASKLVFNGRLDCFWLGLRTVPRLLRRAPVMFDEAGGRVSDVLLIQTENRRLTTRALERTVREKAVNAERVAVFCSRQEADHFEQHPLVDRVFSYGKGDWKETLSILHKLQRERWDVVVGLFTGRPIFRLQKLLFLFLPARHRLVFNPHLDCLYLKRSRVARALRLPSLLVPRQGDSGAFKEALRKLARGTMFFPRFAYLMAWLSVVKLKRAREQAGSSH